jgi:N-acetyl-gamma-glutamyl-phosphate reductase
MIRVGIVGISGYSGLTILELLLSHPKVRVTYVGANTTTGKLSEIWPRLSGRTELVCETFDATKAITNCDLVFLATPHSVSMTIVPQLLNGKIKVIDLSGDYRLSSASLYKKWYGHAHSDSRNLKKAVYGLPELYRTKIKQASFISNPGCYPTAAILGLAPFVSLFPELIDSIIIDAKSGVSGAGRQAKIPYSFCEVNESFRAYKVLKHQHSPEIEQYLTRIADKDILVDFVPHLLPINRGILETIYIRTKEKVSLPQLHSVYRKFYKKEPFVRICPLEEQPELKNVNQTNFCDIGLSVGSNGNLITITSVIDNLVKGAAGQAVQNMNIMNNFEETEGLL